ATHGIWVLARFRVHSRSPEDSETAIIMPPWLITKTTPRSTTGRAGSGRTPAAEVSAWRDSESRQVGLPLAASKAPMSPAGKGATTTPPLTAGLTLLRRVA